MYCNQRQFLKTTRMAMYFIKYLEHAPPPPLPELSVDPTEATFSITSTIETSQAGLSRGFASHLTEPLGRWAARNRILTAKATCSALWVCFSNSGRLPRGSSSLYVRLVTGFNRRLHATVYWKRTGACVPWPPSTRRGRRRCNGSPHSNDFSALGPWWQAMNCLLN